VLFRATGRTSTVSFAALNGLSACEEERRSVRVIVRGPEVPAAV
jgi:hypothetical protein